MPWFHRLFTTVTMSTFKDILQRSVSLLSFVHSFKVLLNTVKHITKVHTEGISLRSSCIRSFQWSCQLFKVFLLLCWISNFIWVSTSLYLWQSTSEREWIIKLWGSNLTNNKTIWAVVVKTETPASTVFNALIAGCKMMPAEAYWCLNTAFTVSISSSPFTCHQPQLICPNVRL